MSTAQAAPTAEVVIPATTSDLPVRSALLNTGPRGYLRHEAGRGTIWRAYGAATDVQVDSVLEYDGGNFQRGTGSDVVAHYLESSRQVELRDMVAGETFTLPLPFGHDYVGAFGRHVLTYDSPDGGGMRFHALDMETGQLRDRLVEGVPAGVRSFAVLPGVGDADGLLMSLPSAGTVWMDVTQRRVVPILTDTQLTMKRFALTRDRLLIWSNDQVSVYSRSDLTKPERLRPLPESDAVRLLGMVGGELVVARNNPALGRPDENLPVWQLEAHPLDGSAVRTLLARSSGRASFTPNGGLLVHGGASIDQWGVQLLQADAAGQATVSRETPVQVKAVANTIHQMSFQQGRLTSVEAEAAAGRVGLHTRTTEQYDGVPSYGERRNRGWVPDQPEACFRYGYCPKVEETGDGRIAYGGAERIWGDPVVPLYRLAEGAQLPGTKIDTGSGYAGFVGSWGRWAVVRATVADGTGVSRIIDLDTGKVARTLPVHPLSLSGTTLWTSRYNNEAVGYDIRTGVETKSAYLPGCFLDAAEAIGRWLHWTCTGSRNDEGVFDLETRTNTPLGIGYGAGARLGDGFIVYPVGSSLKLKDLRDGGTVHTLTDDRVSYQPWAVDPATGTVAWTDTKNAVHLVGSGVAVSAPTAVDSDVPLTQAVNGGSAPWRPRWWLSSPAASWQLTVRNASTGAVVRTLDGGDTARGLVAPVWDGKDAAGRLVTNGSYAWSFTAEPVNGQAGSLAKSGTVNVTGAAAVRRDHAGPTGPDAVADLVSLSASGALAFRHGSGTGGLAGATTGSGWSTSAVAVPFGDLNGDRCNDVLVRLGGELRAYRPGCGKALTPTTAYTSLGTVWGQFNVLTSPGDLTGDGRPDLIARQTSTGDIYLYADNGVGKLASRGRIGTNWKVYRSVFGAGDLNGDGIGDLLAVDGANSLWRYDGTAVGTVKPRVLVFGSNWATGRNVFVGVGDLNRDGKADLISRNAAGDLLRNSGNGVGSFGSTVKIGAGWQGYKGLF
ncbi:FG-GAP-like repeat-containing protein [Streptomyces sp. NBC_01481]|uniref:FG-GAP-like repeat-containing protein n=1 Tax=Streptomyces sp. NBC_01481 TaxID=2975869 RepID=UPI00225344A7|nr:FG-GAP-like repeat-containing protein [Streptomyces sp. NBC_01481]MCX4584322.1 FG-GAP-like repeat-containing protein [Streptomyces sp. NBC_01481]